MSQHAQNARLALTAAAIWAVALLLLGGIAKAANVTYANVDQSRDPIGPPSVPDFSLPNQILLPTPAYEVQDDDVSAVDQAEASFRFDFDAAVTPGRVATTVGLRQRLGFEIEDPEGAENFVRTATVATIAYTEINGAPVDPTDPANQQQFTLDATLQAGDVLPGGLIEMLVPLDAPATAFEVSLDNALIAFSTSGTTLITGADLQFITLTETAVPEPTSLGLIGLVGCALAGLRRRAR